MLSKIFIGLVINLSLVLSGLGASFGDWLFAGISWASGTALLMIVLNHAE